MFVASISLRAQGKNDHDIPKETRLKIEAAQRDVKAALYSRSMAFGDRRLVLNDDFTDLVKAMGAPNLLFNKLIADLPEEKQNTFGIDRAYEPVPAPDGFGILPEAVTGVLAKHIEDRMSKQFYIGLRDTTMRLEVASMFYHTRLKEYHDGQGVKTRVVLREVVVSDLADMHRLLARFNIVNSDKLNEIDVAFANVVSYQIDELRKSAEKRVLAIESALAAHDIVKRYLGG